MLNNNITISREIFVGLDVHTTNITITFYDPLGDNYKYESNLPADNSKLIAYLKRMHKRHYSDDHYDYHFVIGYEAGYTGYRTYRELIEHDFECVILAPNTIKRSPKQKKIKNDKADARLIAKTLANGDYSEVYTLSQEDEAVSHLLKLHDSTVEDMTRVKNQISALLTQKGFKFDSTKTKWTQKFKDAVYTFIKQEKIDEDKFTLEHYMMHLELLEFDLKEIMEKIEKVAKKERYAEDVAKLRSLKGVDTYIALCFIVAIGDINRFATAESLANYLGLTPGEQSSGLSEHHTGITKSGNKGLRKLAILGAQTYSRGSEHYISKDLLKRRQGLDPEVIQYAEKARIRLHKKYRHLRYDLNKNHNLAVCAVARELVCFIWGLLTGNIH